MCLMLCEWIIVRKDFGNNFVIGHLTNNEQWWECDLFYTPMQAYCDDNSVLINFDNLSSWKAPYNFGDMHTKMMDVGWNEIVFAFHLIDQTVYQGLSCPYHSSKMMVSVRCQLNYKCNTFVVSCLGTILIISIMLSILSQIKVLVRTHHS